MKFNSALYPPSGWQFIDTQGVTHIGKSLAQLISRVVNYRVINGLAVGDPAVEVNAQLCKNYPGYCKSAYNPLRPKRLPPQNKGCTSCGKKRKRR
jgi:hypothetical protein